MRFAKTLANFVARSMPKKYKAGFFFGRLQHVHKGHQRIIDHGLEQCEKFVVFVGSSQESGTKRNPFSADMRIGLLKMIYGDRLVVVPVPDLTNEDDLSRAWGRYVLDIATEALGEKPDYMVTGEGDSQEHWFTADQIASMTNNMTFDVVPRSEVPISGTKMREYIMLENFDEWSKFVDPRIHGQFYSIRTVLLEYERRLSLDKINWKEMF